MIDRNDTYLYEMAPGVAASLELMYFDLATTVVAEPRAPTPEPEILSGECSACHISVHQDRAHYKSDLHRLNLKRQVRGQAPLTEDEFDRMVEEQSIESLSGSELEDELETLVEQVDLDDVVSHLNTRLAFLLFKSSLLPEGKAFGIYKAVFTSAQIESPQQALGDFGQAGGKISALFMIGGGHFAGAIVSHKRKNIKGNVNAKESRQEQQVDVLDSKTFHRYTTRRKQGGSQSASDNARGKANSAGSSIRRYNEQALIKEVRELLAQWKHHLDQCDSIYIRANGASNRKILVGYEGAVLANNDPRIRGFPFTTKRATKSELKKAWVNLTYMSVVDVPKVDKKAKPAKQSKLPSTTPAPEAPPTPEETHTAELVALLRKSKAPLVIAYFKKNKLSPNMALEPVKAYIHHPTPLHYAASQGLHHMVQILLVNLKADPTVTNQFGKTPWDLGDASVRRAFQAARHSLGEHHCDWLAAHVGKAKLKEEFVKEDEQQRQRETAEKRRLIEEELAKKTDLELKQPTVKSSGVLLGLIPSTSGLSDDQRMRLMREQRARAAEARLRGVR